MRWATGANRADPQARARTFCSISRSNPRSGQAASRSIGKLPMIRINSGLPSSGVCSTGALRLADGRVDRSVARAWHCRAFRGVLLTRLTDVLGSSRTAVTVSVVIPSVLFASLHSEQGLVGATISGLAGVAFSVLRLRCHTLWAPVLAHGFDNTIGFVWFFLFGPVYGLW